MDHLDKLEAKSVHILREAYAAFDNLCMLWSIGKDSTVLLWLARKAFYGHVPFPLVHVDTHYKIPEMIEYRDRLAKEMNLYMIYGENREALELDGFDKALPNFREFIAAQKSYQKNRHQISPALREKINRHLGFYFEHYGYEMEV